MTYLRIFGESSFHLDSYTISPRDEIRSVANVAKLHIRAGQNIEQKMQDMSKSKREISSDDMYCRWEYKKNQQAIRSNENTANYLFKFIHGNGHEYTIKWQKGKNRSTINIRKSIKCTENRNKNIIFSSSESLLTHSNILL